MLGILIFAILNFTLAQSILDSLDITGPASHIYKIRFLDNSNIVDASFMIINHPVFCFLSKSIMNYFIPFSSVPFFEFLNISKHIVLFLNNEIFQYFKISKICNGF